MQVKWSIVQTHATGDNCCVITYNRASIQVVVVAQDKFFAQLKSSTNGFGVIADFFGRGLLDASSVSTFKPSY